MTTASSQVAQAKEALAQLTPTQSAIEVAEAQAAQAQAALDLARAAAQDAVLTAPFDGAVGAIDVDVGQVVSPGAAVMSVGDLPELQVETTDLVEVDVTRVSVGQAANLTFDALPGETFQGQVTRVAPEANTYRGDQVYMVTIDLPASESKLLRWGMTANVTFPTQ